MSITSDPGSIKELIKSTSILVFDFDGVLADSVEVKTDGFVEIYEPFGKEVVAKVVDHHRNNGGMSRYKKFKYYHQELLNKNISDIEVAYLSDKFSSLVVERVIDAPEIPGAGDFLVQFCTNKTLCVVNSATPTNEIIKIINARGLSHFFNDVYGSPNTKKENLVEIQKQYGINIKNGIFIGDAMSDFNAAQSMGMSFIGVGKKIVDFLKNEEGEWLGIDDFSCVINNA